MKIQRKEPIFDQLHFRKLTTVLSAAAVLSLSPLLERTAQAQDPAPPTSLTVQGNQDQGQTQGNRRYGGLVSTNTNILSLLASEMVLGQPTFPATITDLTVTNIDQNGVEFTLNFTQNTITTLRMRVNYDGTRSGEPSLLENLGLLNFSVERAEGGQARVNFEYSDRPVSQRPPPVTAPTRPLTHAEEMRRSNYLEYQDLSLHPYPDRVDLTGRRRDITLNHDWDLGGNVYSNEGGSSVWATLRYAPLMNGQTTTPIDLRLSAGNMWFGEQAAPFARLLFRPSFEFWRFRAVYYGSVATVQNLPSWLYTSHSLGLGFSQPIGQDARLRLGIVAGGALSVPSWDDIYFNIATGASFQYRNWLIYAMPSFYMAASDPIKVAYVGNYSPQFQNVEFGVQASFLNEYTGRVFGDISTLYQRAGGRLTRSFTLSNDVSLDVWGAAGATHWIDTLGGRWDPMVFAGINVVLGGRAINSTSTIRYEHMQSGGVRFATTDIPNQQNPGPYGFGRSGNAQVDSQVNQAKNNILSSDSLQSFSTSYNGSSQNDVIMTARFLGAFAQQAAYANNAWNQLNNTQFFNSDVQRIASQSPETIYQFMRRLVDFYNTHDPRTPLPADLVNGIALCGGIGFVQSAFLNANGVPTIVATVNTRNGPHMVPIANASSGTVLLDYGNTYTTPPGTFDQAMRFYGQNAHAPTFQSQLFTGIDSHYLGTYITSEGRLLHESIGIVNSSVLATDFLGVR